MRPDSDGDDPHDAGSDGFIASGDQLLPVRYSVISEESSWSPGIAADLSRQLASLAAIVVLHFEKEEEALLPLLDEALTPEAAGELFARLGHGEHSHTH